MASASTVTVSTFRTALRDAGDAPPDLVSALGPEVPSLAIEIVREIRESVDDFGDLPEQAPRSRVVATVERTLHQFIDQIANPAGTNDHCISVYRRIGREAYETGTGLDALQSAYRVGARVAWRRIADAGRRAGWSAETMSRLAEAVFAYVEELAEHSVQGHAQAGGNTTDRVTALRAKLLELVLAGPNAEQADTLAGLAREARWRIPATVACVAVAPAERAEPHLPPAVAEDVLADLGRQDACLVVPDPDAPGRHEMLARALRDSPFAVGPSVPLARAAASHRLAVQTLSLMRRGIIAFDRYVLCSDELPTLVLFRDEDVIALMAERLDERLAPLKPPQRARLTETLQAWIVTGGRVPRIAELLHVHVQTVRYRLRRLHELFGDDLDDADWKFGMEMVLRAKSLTGSRE
ncbi:PucR family transcriptional regulator [Actinomadura montaniterrae]|nr:PucR family transcriptional regulator [Actinomadura montaniterrae]